MSLNDSKIRNLKPSAKPFKVSDSHNINPAQQRSAERTTSSPEKTFKHVALEWHKSNRSWSENYSTRLLASMNNHIFL